MENKSSTCHMTSEQQLIMVDAHKLEELLSECLDVIKSIKPTQIPLLQSLLVWIGYCKKPTVDAVEVVHGRWIEGGKADVGDVKGRILHCSKCGDYCYNFDPIPPHNYCPNCGAKMDGDGNA